VAVDLPSGGLPGDYHIQPTYNSPAKNTGVAASLTSLMKRNIPTMPRCRISTAKSVPAGTDSTSGADEFDLPFPTTSILDNFNRGDGSSGGNWAGDTKEQYYRINANEVQVRSSGAVWWVPMHSASTRKLTSRSRYQLPPERACFAQNERAGPWQPPTTLRGSRSATTMLVKVCKSARRIRRVNPVIQGTFPITLQPGDILGAQGRSRWLGNSCTKTACLSAASMYRPVPRPGYYPDRRHQSRSELQSGVLTNQNDARFDDFGGGGALAAL
jgi:hypothetical protein